MGGMATALRMLGYGIAFFIGIGIALVVLDANESSEVVEWWLDACRFLVGPFDDIFDLERGKEHEQIAINWGIAAVVYVVVASVLARLASRAGKVRT
jgi:UDP-N-acetylmuramyl pentapeptide phosphotransferase/UDP-N-acetylglucosamine-1-phosphate transferase